MMMDEQKEMNHMRELVELLNRARRSYEQENTEIMSNYEFTARGMVFLGAWFCRVDHFKIRSNSEPTL